MILTERSIAVPAPTIDNDTFSNLSRVVRAQLSPETAVTRFVVNKSTASHWIADLGLIERPTKGKRVSRN